MEIGDTEIVTGHDAVATQDRLHTKEELLDVERLGDVVVATLLKAPDAIPVAVSCSQEASRSAPLTQRPSEVLVTR